jgi:hypothetical protein
MALKNKGWGFRHQESKVTAKEKNIFGAKGNDKKD